MPGGIADVTERAPVDKLLPVVCVEPEAETDDPNRSEFPPSNAVELSGIWQGLERTDGGRVGWTGRHGVAGDDVEVSFSGEAWPLPLSRKSCAARDVDSAVVRLTHGDSATAAFVVDNVRQTRLRQLVDDKTISILYAVTRNIYQLHTIRERCCFNVQSNADTSQLNLPHGLTTKKCKNRKTKK